MSTLLKTAYPSLLTRLHDAQQDSIPFAPADFPSPDLHWEDHRLIVSKHQHFYDEFPVDQLYFSAEKQAYQQLALLVLAAIFNRTPSVLLQLTHPHSTIKTIQLDTQGAYSHYLTDGFEAALAPQQYLWSYREFPKHPWYPLSLTEKHALPRFQLTGAENDCLLIAPSLAGMSRFAELLLTISAAQATGNEYVLETDAGFVGVAPASVEAAFWLPGGLGYVAA